MSGRRVPLSSNPNAINSPYKPAAATASKQKRSYANLQREEAYGQPPPSKKQMLETHVQASRTPPPKQSTLSVCEGRRHIIGSQSQQGASQTLRRQLPQSTVEGRMYIKRARDSVQERRNPVREKPHQGATKADKTEEENLEQVRQWQKHYRKLFPTFVFYFESIPEDARVTYTKQVTALGAREVKFFSNEVTHVVTTRPIPEQSSSIGEAHVNSSTANSNGNQPQTINPILLNRSSESTNTASDLGGRGKFTFEAPVKRLATNINDGETKRKPVRSADVLHRALDLGMKIWALEKLQRMMEVMFDKNTKYSTAHGHNTRSNSVQGSAAISRNNREADLSQLLRNERINGPSDRDPTVATKELNIFKGPYIYIHDIDEKQKPIMVREYAKVANKGDGDWPQFRSVANGKCPFIEEVDYNRREAEKEKEMQMLRLQQQQEKEKLMVPRTRSASAVESARMQPPRAVNGKRTLTDMDAGSSRVVTVSTKQANPFATSKASFAQRMAAQEPSSRITQNAFVSRAGAGRLFGGEPVASGVQPSNITSAIRSQMISSTSAQPGAKTGTSKELHGLQRQVLEKNSGGPGSHGLTSSHRMTDFSITAKDDYRPTKRRTEDKLGLIEEDIDPSEAEETARKVEVARMAKAVQKRKLEKRDPKPGYCENCQEKFEDFDEHVMSRKHRKFADKLENWKELDALLSKLARPLRDEAEDIDF